MENLPGQQPTARVVGRRLSPAGRPPDAATWQALAALARYRTRAPKGVFKYQDAQEMESDRKSWIVAAMLAGRE
jgi:hypothetical protein